MWLAVIGVYILYIYVCVYVSCVHVCVSCVILMDYYGLSAVAGLLLGGVSNMGFSPGPFGYSICVAALFTLCGLVCM